MSSVRRDTTVTTPAGDVPGRWTWDPTRPWVLNLVVEHPGGGYDVARIGREALSLVLRYLPLAVCGPDVQVWLDTTATPGPVLWVQINRVPAPGDRVGSGPDAQIRQWSADPADAAVFLVETERIVAMCLNPKRCKGCAECTAIADRVDVLTAHRGVR